MAMATGWRATTAAPAFFNAATSRFLRSTSWRTNASMRAWIRACHAVVLSASAAAARALSAAVFLRCFFFFDFVTLACNRKTL